ncbi:50S ribosomal protein L11 methyltransferase [Myxococcota bacterium]|nr:50S ribosomal protein L11 methyltransferase [Myxococcota bacterium]
MIDVAPHWIIHAPGERPVGRGTPIALAPGVGWGTGDHPSTTLCLQALGHLMRIAKPRRVLDFGAGSGLLAIGAALHGATVDAVEIDPAALEHTRANAALNGVEAALAYSTTLREPPEAFDLVLANILRPILVDFAPALAARTSRAGHLVLAGLVATDVPFILAAYGPLLAPMRPQVYERGEWRCLVFSP